MDNRPKITLQETRGGTKRKFDFAHALNLLRLQEKNKSNGWIIADEKYIFKDNEICRKPSNRDNQKAEK